MPPLDDCEVGAERGDPVPRPRPCKGVAGVDEGVCAVSASPGLRLGGAREEEARVQAREGDPADPALPGDGLRETERELRDAAPPRREGACDGDHQAPCLRVSVML